MAEIKKSNSYKTIEVTGFAGNWHFGRLEIAILSEELKAEEGFKEVTWEPYIECRLKLTPWHAKKLLKLLELRINKYEQDLGEIKLEPEEKPQPEEPFEYIG